MLFIDYTLKPTSKKRGKKRAHCKVVSPIRCLEITSSSRTKKRRKRERRNGSGTIRPPPHPSTAGCTKTQLYTFSYTPIFQMTIFICLSNFFRMPEKCLIIFAFHIEKRGRPRLYRPDISFKKCVQTRTGPSYIYILGGPPLFRLRTRQKSDVIF